MRTTDVEKYLQAHAERIEVGPPPVAGIVADGARARRQGTLALGAAAAVVVAVTAVGGTFLAGNGAQTAGPQIVTPSGPVADGQWVGLNGVGFDVPETWDTTLHECGGASFPTRQVAGSAAGAVTDPCAPPADDVVQMTFLVMTSEQRAALVGEPQGESVLREADGLSYEVMGPTCDLSTQSRCIAGLWFPEHNLSVTINGSADDSAVDDLIASVRAVPSTPTLEPQGGGDAASQPDDQPSGRVVAGEKYVGAAGFSYSVPAGWEAQTSMCGEAPTGTEPSLDALAAENGKGCSWSWEGDGGRLLVMDMAGGPDARATAAKTFGGLEGRGEVDGRTYGTSEISCAEPDGTTVLQLVCAASTYLPDPGVLVNISSADEAGVRVVRDSLRFVPADERD